MIKVDLKQQTAEWLEFRKSRIGASDAPIIMGDAPWSTPLQLWENKVGLRPDNFRTEAMQRGIDLEPLARHCFSYETDIWWIQPAIAHHETIPWMMASLDGINEGKKIILEIKCPSKFTDHEIAKSGKIPEKYYPQVQHQLEVVGYDRGYYFSYIDDSDFAIVEFERDQKYIDEILAKEAEFYECMRNFISPPLTKRDYVCKNDIFWESRAEEYLKIKELIEKEKQVREELIQMANGENCQGAGIRVQKVTRKGTVDYSRIPELKGVDLEKYRSGLVEFWKIIKE